MKGHIQNRLLAAFLSVAALPLAGVGLYSIHSSTEALRELALTSAKERARLKARKAEEMLHDIRGDLLFLARSPMLLSLLDEVERDPVLSDFWRQKLGQQFIVFAQNKPAYTSLYYISEKGREVVRAEHDGLRAWMVPDERLGDWGTREDFRAAAVLPAGEVHVSSPGRSDPELREPVVRYALRAVDRRGQRRGVLVADVFARQAFEPSPPETEGSALLNGEGHPLSPVGHRRLPSIETSLAGIRGRLLAGESAVVQEQVRLALFDLALVDLKMPGPDGMIVLDAIRRTSPETFVVVITGHATVESAVEAMKLGAFDYLAKPFKLDQVRHVVRRAVEQKRLVDQNRRLRQEVEGYHRFEQLVGGSPRMQEVFRAIERAAPTSSTILITGETGTGKELVARALHRRSKRAEGPFIVVSCGAISESLLESELFGHVRGAFTGAHADREGLFEAAQGGTLFLDEIGDIPSAMQMKLLRALQEREIQRVGETRIRKVDVRLIAATHKDLQEEVRAGRFREDLYYRLNVLTLVLPPLRERREDIPLLVRHFLQKYGQEMGKAVADVAPEALDLLTRCAWPGNVRELQNVLERAVILIDGQVLRPEHLPLTPHPSPRPLTQNPKASPRWRRWSASTSSTSCGRPGFTRAAPPRSWASAGAPSTGRSGSTASTYPKKKRDRGLSEFRPGLWLQKAVRTDSPGYCTSSDAAATTPG